MDQDSQQISMIRVLELNTKERFHYICENLSSNIQPHHIITASSCAHDSGP